MKQLRLVALVLAASLACAAIAFACGGGKCASSANASCSAGNAAAASGSSCCASGASASAANAKGAKTAKAAKGAKGTACCSPEMAAACTPEMKAACASGASGACGMHGTATAAMTDCAVCAEGASCDEDVNAAGARRQVVGLKNGAMIVYTTDGPENVRALQASVARHNAVVVGVLGGKRAGNLCAHCKPLRGAMASGKLTREVVNVQLGAQVVITSNDRATVQRIHDMTGAEMATRVRD